MTYSPPLHIGIVLSGKLAKSEDVTWWVEAVRKQIVEHVCPAWKWKPPGIFVYTADTYVPKAEGCLLAVVDDDGDDDAAGFHSLLGGQPYGLVDLHQSADPSVTLSHEVCEIVGNWNLDRWSAPDANGRQMAMELCDPCERQTYPVSVEMFGQTRIVEVSSFVLPAWFPGSPDQMPFTYPDGLGMDVRGGILDGGYAIARERDGTIVYLASGAMRAKKSTSRTMCIVEGGRPKPVVSRVDEFDGKRCVKVQVGLLRPWPYRLGWTFTLAGETGKVTATNPDEGFLWMVTGPAKAPPPR